ncbi:pyridoxal phosphate-dependent transferase [Filobasidium floriforme]|uniref:pyridoxal phosphate-dependent transferase n=1 Tax=Filobasidium floriforme TaxID=5210 RepID=UPI001E8DA324|nr:pyridoxal phosphate-dependent transferase [Filobasidium floriforme]KAH8079618.1 pyridoxal phosphate-dependent transferase [Filobasidium floriforme]
MSTARSFSTRIQEGADPGLYMKTFVKIANDPYHPSSNPGGIVGLGVAENLLMGEELVDLSRRAMTSNFTTQDLSYGDDLWGSKRLHRALAGFLNEWFEPYEQAQPEHIITSAGLSCLIDQLTYTLFNPSEGILILRPYYAGFNRDFCKRNGVKLIGVTHPPGESWEGPDGLGQAFEMALKEAEDQGTKVRGIVLCNPHNPTGRVVPRSIVLGYCDFAERHDLQLISDEIYAQSVFSSSESSMHEIRGSKFTSALNLDVEKETGRPFDRSRLHVLYGMSKDFGANGFRIGVLINQDNQELFRLMAGMSIFSKISAPADVIFSALLSSEYLSTYLLISRERLRVAHDLVETWFSARGCTVYRCDAGPFLWVDMGDRLGITTWEEEAQWHTRLFEEGKVYISLGATYKSERPGYFRITFAVPESTLLEGLGRMEKILGLQIRSRSTHEP